MKLKIAWVLASLAAILTIGLIGWLFTLHGTRGLVHVEWISGAALIFIALVSLLPVILTVVSILIRKDGRSRPRLQISAIAIAPLGILIPMLAIALFSGFPSSTGTDNAPRLIIAASQGSAGIPNIAVAVKSRESSEETLTWGTTGTEATIIDHQASNEHIFMLSDLTPGTDYWYRVGQGPEYYFSTPNSAAPLHFAVESDAHFAAGDNRPDLTQAMLAQIAAPSNGFDYLFSLGDNVEYGFRPEQWQEVRAAFDPVVSQIPAAFAAGNHDATFTGLGRYLEYAYPDRVEIDNGTRLWHRFDVGNIHFIVLDVEWSAESFTEKQASWLEAELKTIPKDDWTFVMSHGFYYGSGSVTRGWKWYDNPETIDRITPLFEQYGVDVVFSGHAHQMELLQKSGVTYIIDGAFGGPPDSERTYTSPASLWYASGKYGFADVSVGKDQANIVFRGPDGQEIHSATVNRLR